MNSYLSIAFSDLVLIPATAQLAQAELRSQSDLCALLRVLPPPSWPPPLTADTLELFAAELSSEPSKFPWSKWYLLHSPPGGSATPVGIVGFKTPPVLRRVEIGYSVIPERQCCGFASRAVTVLLQWCDGTGLVDVVEAQTLPDLLPSLRVLEKTGFSFARQGQEDGQITVVWERCRR